MKLRVMEIFDSINGEVCFAGQGSLATFIRLAGCNLKCSYCDTAKSQSIQAGEFMFFDEIMGRINQFNITITGGEPFMHYPVLKELLALIRVLKPECTVTIETNGSILKRPDHCDCLVIDYKLPSSGMNDMMPDQVDYINWCADNLEVEDWVKFVIADRRDYEIAKDMAEYLFCLSSRIRSAFSAVSPTLNPKELAEWMLADKLTAVLNVQLHKVIGVA